MANYETMVLVARGSGELYCQIKPDQNMQRCDAGCVGCGQNRQSQSLFSLPADLLPSTAPEGQRFELVARDNMLIALSSLVYLAPVLLMLLFSVCCSAFYPEREGLIALAAVGGFGIGAGTIILCGDKIRQRIQTRLSVRS